MFLSHRCLGVEISGREIRLAGLRRAGRKHVIMQAAQIIASSSEPSDIAEALQQYLDETRTRPDSIVCSIPTNSCAVKFAEVPPARPADLAKMVRFEAESHIPLPLSEVVWSYVTDKRSLAGKWHVVMVSARRSIVGELLDAMNAAAIHPDALVVSGLAAVRSAAPAERYDGPVLLVDIGSEWCDVCVVDEGQIYGAHSARLGCAGLTEAFVSDYGVDVETAEEMKRERGIDLSTRTVSAAESSAEFAVEAWVKKLADEIGQSAVSLTIELPHLRPRRVVLVGSGAGVPGMAEAIARWSGMSVMIGDPWNGMKLSEVCAFTTHEPEVVYSVATGLAMLGLDRRPLANLLLRRAAAESLLTRSERAILVSLSAMAAVLLVVFVIGASGLHRTAGELADLSARGRHARQALRRAGPGHRAEATAVRTMVADIKNDRASCINFLRLASEDLPRSVWLSDLSCETGKSIVLKGGALSNSAVADAVDSLTSLQLFDAVNLDYSNLSRATGSQSYDFQITCALSTSAGPASHVRTGIVVQ